MQQINTILLSFDVMQSAFTVHNILDIFLAQWHLVYLTISSVVSWEWLEWNVLLPAFASCRVTRKTVLHSHIDRNVHFVYLDQYNMYIQSTLPFPQGKTSGRGGKDILSKIGNCPTKVRDGESRRKWRDIFFVPGNRK